MRTFEILVTEEVLYTATVEAETAAEAEEIAAESADLDNRQYLATNNRYAKVQA